MLIPLLKYKTCYRGQGCGVGSSLFLPSVSCSGLRASAKCLDCKLGVNPKKFHLLWSLPEREIKLSQERVNATHLGENSI